MDSPISFDDFKALVGKTNSKGSCRLKLHLVLIRIVEARHGAAFPTHMGKLTKVQLTTGAVQAAPNMVQIGTRLFTNKEGMVSFGFTETDLEVGEEPNGLDSLTQAHLICEDPVEAIGPHGDEPPVAIMRVRVRVRVRGQGRGGDSHWFTLT